MIVLSFFHIVCQSSSWPYTSLRYAVGQCNGLSLIRGNCEENEYRIFKFPAKPSKNINITLLLANHYLRILISDAGYWSTFCWFPLCVCSQIKSTEQRKYFRNSLMTFLDVTVQRWRQASLVHQVITAIRPDLVPTWRKKASSERHFSCYRWSWSQDRQTAQLRNITCYSTGPHTQL